MESFGKKLTELRVIDLKSELEQRGQDAKGVKAVLIEKLHKCLEEEGKKPEEYLFDLCSTPVKKSGSTADKDDQDECESLVEEKPDVVMVDGGEDGLNGCANVEEIMLMDITDCDLLNKEDSTELRSEELPAVIEPATVMDLVWKPATTESEPTTVVTTVVKTASSAVPESESSASTSVEVEAGVKTNSLDKTNTSPPTIKEGPESAVSEIIIETSVIASTMVDATAKRNNPAELIVSSKETDSVKEVEDSLVVHLDDDAENDLDSDLTLRKNAEVVTNDTTDNKDATDKMDTVNVAGVAMATEEPTEVTNEPQEKTDEKEDKKEEIKKDEPKAKSTATKSPTKVSGRNLWVSGLAASTRATDLKTLFTKHGKVTGAKVVTNARSPGSRCYGYVSMASAEEATKCIQHLHRTELHGRMISVEKAKSDPAAQTKTLAAKKVDSKVGGVKKTDSKPGGRRKDDRVDRRDGRMPHRDSRYHGRPHVRPHYGHSRREPEHGSSRHHSHTSPRHGSKPHTSPKDKDKSVPTKPVEEKPVVKTEGDTKEEEKKVDEVREEVKKESDVKEEGDAAVVAGETEESRKKEEMRASSKTPSKKEDKMADEKTKDVESLEKIKLREERERRRRVEERRRMMERRRVNELYRQQQQQRIIDRRQKLEEMRLQRESIRIRLEREKLEREKMEAERLMKERLLLERERKERERLLEKEREEIRRLEQLRLEEQRRALKRSFESRAVARDDGYWEGTKRSAVSDSRFNSRSGFQQVARFNDFDHRDTGRNVGGRMETARPQNVAIDRRVERYDRREGRTAVAPRRSDLPSRDSRDIVKKPSPQHTRRDRDDRGRINSNRMVERTRDAVTRDRPSRDQGLSHDRPSASARDQPRSSGDRARPPLSSSSDRTGHRGSDRYSTNPAVKSSTGINRTSWPASDVRSSKIVTGGSWQAPGLVQSNTRSTDHWPSSAVVDSRSRLSNVMGPPLLQNPGSNQAFLTAAAQAANIMMGAGLARPSQDTRYDAYKPVSGVPPRRY